MPGIVCIAESHQVLAQLLDTLLVIGTQLPENPTVRNRLIEVACKVFKTQTADSMCTLYHYKSFLQKQYSNVQFQPIYDVINMLLS